MNGKDVNGDFYEMLTMGLGCQHWVLSSKHYCRPLGYRHSSILFALDSAARLNYNPIDNAIEKHWGECQTAGKRAEVDLMSVNPKACQEHSVNQRPY